MYIKLFIIACVFLLGSYYITHPCNQEGFKGSFNKQCPNLLIQKNNDIEPQSTEVKKRKRSAAGIV